jgi:hypothetical protein
MTLAGTIWTRMTSSRIVWLDLSHNRLTPISVANQVTSYQAAAPVTFDLSYNNLTTIVEQTIGRTSDSVPLPMTINMSHNPLRTLSSVLFSGTYSLGDVTIDISSPTTGPVVFPEHFSFAASWFPGRVSTLTFIASNTGATIATVVAFREFLQPTRFVNASVADTGLGGCGTGCNLTLILRDNRITMSGTSALSDAKVTKLDLGSNRISAIAGNAFNYSFELQELVRPHR